MKKQIKINSSYLVPWMRDYYFELLGDRFEFVEETLQPDYVLIGTSHPNYLKGEDYISHRYLNDFPDSAIRIYLQHEAVGFDTSLFDYAVLFTDDLKLDDRVFFANFFSAGYFKVLDNQVFERLNAPKADPRVLLAAKTAFCNFIYSHGGVPERERLFKTLSGYRLVESHGKLLNNINPEEKKKAESHYRGNWFEEGICIKSRSKFSIAAENALHPKGYYISEKLVTAMLANTIPIYWGNPQAGRMFNPRSFINCHDYSSFEEVLSRVAEIDGNDDLWCEIMSEPWMTPEQYFHANGNQAKLKEFLTNVFSTPIESARRRPRGFWVGRYEKAKRNLLTDAAKYRREHALDIPELRARLCKRFEGGHSVLEIETLVSELRGLRVRMNRAQWLEFINPVFNTKSAIMKLAAEPAVRRGAGVKLAAAFYNGGRKWGLEPNRGFAARLLRDLVEDGILEGPKCPSKALLYWGMINMNGEPPYVQRNPEVALECFKRIENHKSARVRHLAIQYRAQTLYERNEPEPALDEMMRLLMDRAMDRPRVTLLIDILGYGVSLSADQRKSVRAVLKPEAIRDMENWRKMGSMKLPWRFRRRVKRLAESLQKGGCFAA